MPESPSGAEQGALIVLGRERQAPWVQVYNELIDLYAEHIGGFAGIGHWVYLRRLVNHDPHNDWHGMAYPTTRTLRRVGKVGGETLTELRRMCSEWGLLDLEIVTVPRRVSGRLVGATRRYVYRVNDPLSSDEFQASVEAGELPRQFTSAELALAADDSTERGTILGRIVPTIPGRITRTILPRINQIEQQQLLPLSPKQNNNKAAAPELPGDAVVSAASPPDPDAEQVQALLAALSPDVPATAAEQWLSEHGTQVVAEHLGWLKAEIDAGRRVDSRGGWLRDSFGWSEPPMSYRRLQREQERQAQREAMRQAELAQAEQAASVAAEDRQRLRALRAAYADLPDGRQAEIDAAARAAVTAGPAGSMVDVPPVPDAWKERTIGAVLWRQAVGEILRDGGGVRP